MQQACCTLSVQRELQVSALPRLLGKTDLPTEEQDPDDSTTFINTGIKASFQEMCRQTSFDTLTSKDTKSYDDGHPIRKKFMRRLLEEQDKVLRSYFAQKGGTRSKGGDRDTTRAGKMSMGHVCVKKARNDRDRVTKS